MITLLFGQPHSGKSTLAKALQTRLFIEYGQHTPVIDGDEIRDIFKNKDFSKGGRLRNLQRISDIATFLSHQYPNVIISAVFPYQEARDYLSEINDNKVFIVELQYSIERGRESYHVKDFESLVEGENKMILNTDTLSITDCTSEIFEAIKQNKI